MRPWLRPVLLCACVLATFACTDDSATDETGTEDGNLQPRTVFTLDFDGSSVCGSPVDRVEFATRRVNCWDPELPCTISQDPPWITGTSVACSDLAGSTIWEVEVTQTGQYETQLRALAGDSQEGIHCFAAGGDKRTNVTNADLETQAVFGLTKTPDSDCSNP